MSAPVSAAAGISASALALILAALAMLGPFSVDTYLPAFQRAGGTADADCLYVFIRGDDSVARRAVGCVWPAQYHFDVARRFRGGLTGLCGGT